MKANKLLLVTLCLISLTACTASETDPTPFARTQRPLATSPVVNPVPAQVTTPPPTQQLPAQGESTPVAESNLPTSAPIITRSPASLRTVAPLSEPIALPDSCALSNVKCDEIQLSPDGRYLVYTETKLDEPEGCGLREDLYVVDAVTLQPMFTQHLARFSAWLPPHRIEIIDVQAMGCDGIFTLQIVDLLTGEQKSLLAPGGKRGWTPDRTAYYEFGMTRFWIYDVETESLFLPPGVDESGLTLNFLYHTLCWDDAGEHLLFTRHALAEIENQDPIFFEAATTGQREVWRFDRETETFTPLLAHPDRSYFLVNRRLSPNQFAAPTRNLWSFYGEGFECKWSGDWVQVNEVLDVPSAPFFGEPLDPMQFIGTAAEQKCGLFGLDCVHSTLLALNTETGETKPWAEVWSGP